MLGAWTVLSLCPEHVWGRKIKFGKWSGASYLHWEHTREQYVTWWPWNGMSTLMIITCCILTEFPVLFHIISFDHEFYITLCILSAEVILWLEVWLSGNALVLINVVVLRRAWLVPEWVTICGWVNHLVYNHPPRSTQPAIPPWVGAMSTKSRGANRHTTLALSTWSCSVSWCLAKWNGD